MSVRQPHTLSRAGEYRVIVGLLVQPFFGFILSFTLFLAVDRVGWLPYDASPSDPVDAALSFSLGTAVLAILVTGWCVVPMLVWFLKRGPITRRQALLAGTLIGNVPTALIAVGLAIVRLTQGSTPNLSDLAYGSIGALAAIAFGSAIGAAGATVLWWIAGGDIGVTTADTD